MAKLFRADAARRTYNENNKDRLFENIIERLSTLIQERCREQTSIDIALDRGGFEPILQDVDIKNRVFTALDDCGYKLFCHRGYKNILIIEW